MSLLNAFVDSFVCVGFSSERGLTIDPESKNDGSLFSSHLQPTVLAIIIDDRATYPPSRAGESFDSSYPPLNRLSSRNSLVLSTSSGRSTPSSSLPTSTKTSKQYIPLVGYKDIPHYCFPDGVQATYQREKEKIHRFVLTQDGKRSYALALTFQQAFTLKTSKPDDDGVYQINDFKLSTQNTGRSTTSKIPVPLDKQKPASSSATASASSSTTTTTPVVEKRSRKMPSAYPKVDTSSASRPRSTSSHDTDKQSQQPARHYQVQTISSYKKNLSPSVTPPPSRLPRTRSQDNVSGAGTVSPTSSSGMRKRTGSNIPKPVPVSNTSSSASSSSTSSTSSTSSRSTSNSISSDAANPFYLPHCVVLISSQPYWTAMQETISIIYDEIIRFKIEPYSREYKKLIQKYAFLACNTPIPPVPWERFSLSFNVTNDRFVITFDPPINANRSVLDLDLSILLLTINIGKLLDVLAAIFTEQPIIFFSTNYSTLVATLECLLYLIYPLKWNNLYIPLVPNGLRDVYLEGSPGLYIKGAHPRHQAIIEQLNVSVTCNLDNDKNIYVPKYIDFHNIPPTRIHSFIDPITQLLEEIQVARAMKNVPTAARLPMDEQREVHRRHRFETNQKISKIFLALMMDLCGDAFEPIYWKVNPQQSSPTNTLAKALGAEKRNFNHTQTTIVAAAAAAVPTFIKETYLRPKAEGIELEFYRAFVETVAFQNLLKEEMMSTSPTGFKQICQIRSLSNEDQLYHFGNTPLTDNYDNQLESTATLCDSLSSQMLLPLPEWSLDPTTHYLDSCIDIFTDELEHAQQERSPAVLSVYAYLRGCARLARGEYLEGLRDLYLIENPNLFPQKYIETVIIPRLAEECLLDLLLSESFYTTCPEWKKVRLRPISHSMSVIDLDDSDKLDDAVPVPLTPDFDEEEWNIVEQILTYQQFSEHVHRLNIVCDHETTKALFKALLYWTDNPVAEALKRDKTLTNNTNKPADKPRSGTSNFTLQDTLDILTNHRQKGKETPKPPTQSSPSLPTALFESFVDIWQQRNAEKVRMTRHLPEDRQKKESILTVSPPGIVSKKDGPGQIILTQKRLYFLPETRPILRLTEIINIESVTKYQHQTIFSSSKPGIKIHTPPTSSSLPRDNNTNIKSKHESMERESKSSSISLFFKNNQEQELWYTIIVELWSGMTIAHEQCDTAVLNKASRHVVLMDTLANIDYHEEPTSVSDKHSTNPRQKSKQHHNEMSLELALKELSSFTRMRETGNLKPLTAETRNVLTRRLSPSINEIERHAVRCLVFTEHPETGRSSIWCAYGSKLKVFNAITWICDPNDLCFPSLITSMCLDARYKLWVRCIAGQLFVVDTLTRMCDAEIKTKDEENGCQSIIFDPIHNHILTANRTGIITVWNASSWKRLYDMNLLEIYKKSNNIPDKTSVSQGEIKLRNTKEPSKVAKPPSRKSSFFGHSKEPINSIDIPDLPSPTAPAQIIPLSTDRLERIQIYEDLLFACYRDDYIIVLRISNSNIYHYEHLISVKYKIGDSVPIDSFLIYNKQLWVSAGCIISIFDVNNTQIENTYDLLMKKPVDDDNLVTMLGFSGFLWAGSLNGNVYVFRMDNYELYKTFAGHRDSVFCLCSMLDMYVVSGSAQRDTSIAIWENVQTANVATMSSTPTATGSMFHLQGSPNAALGSSKKSDKKDFIKPIDML